MDLNKLHPAERLDYVLNAMKRIAYQPELNNEELHAAIVKTGDTWNLDGMMRVVRKLNNDQLIIQTHCLKNPSHFHYALTFDGDALLDVEGGHIGLRNRSLAAQIHQTDIDAAVSELEKNNLKIQKSIRFLTGAGAWVAGLVLGLELWKFVKDYYYPLFPFFGGR